MDKARDNVVGIVGRRFVREFNEAAVALDTNDCGTVDATHFGWYEQLMSTLLLMLLLIAHDIK